MDINRLVLYLNQGREIELSCYQSQYLLTPDYDNCKSNEIHYFIYDCRIEENIFSGTINQVINYKFLEQYTLQNNLDTFHIAYVL